MFDSEQVCRDLDTRFRTAGRDGGSGISTLAARLRALDRGFVDQHDGYIVLHGIHAMALRAFQTLRLFTVLKRLFALGANQNFQQVFGNHDKRIVRHC